MENIQRTELYQGNVWTANEAPASFDAAGHRIPLVLVPDKRYWCSCYMTIPTGAHSVMHRCGQDEAPNELAQPGLQCLPSCYYIAYCVNKKSITYNAPVKSCPSKDNVMVDCVLALVFQINPEATAVKKFIYMLGAVRFDKFLMAAVEEAIRHLIRGCQHLEVYELKGQGNIRVKDTLDELNAKFNNFGIDFSSAAITDVKFSVELQSTLQNTTEYKSMIDEQLKSHDHEMKVIKHKEIQVVEELTKKNALIIQDTEAQLTRETIRREQHVTDANSRAEVRKTKANQDANVAQVKAEGENQVARLEGQRMKEDLVAKEQKYQQEVLTRVKNECENLVFESEQRVLAAKALCDAMKAMAAAEEKAAGSLQKKREHDLRLAQMEVFQCVGANSKMVVSGDAGERLLNKMLSTDITDTITVAKNM